MTPGSLVMTATLSPLAAKFGVDLTPLAMSEQAFNDMLAATLARDDDAYAEAKARFDACRSTADIPPSTGSRARPRTAPDNSR